MNPTTPTQQTFEEWWNNYNSCGTKSNGEYVATKSAWDTASAQSSAARVLELEGELQMVKEPMLAKNQLCGCIVCTCEDNEENRCNGCGAKNCGNHPVGEFANPVYKPHSVLQSLTKQNSVLRELLKKVHAHLNDGPLVYFKEDDADSPPTDLAEAYQESELWEEITSAITPYKADYLCHKCKVNFAPKKCLCQSCEALEAAAPSEKGGEAK